MTDITQDPDFLRILHSADREWPGYEAPDKDVAPASLPMMISEIFRLTPYIGPKYVNFHPKNMPEVQINKVEIVGIVTSKTHMLKHTSFTVDDTTSAIPVLFKRRLMHEDKASTQEDSDDEEPTSLDTPKAHKMLKPPCGLGPDAPYSYEKHLRYLWHRARDAEPYYDEIDLYDYVHVVGLCAMSFRNKKDISELTDEDIELGRLFLFGINMRRITEAEHNLMTRQLFCEILKKRYQEPNN